MKKLNIIKLIIINKKKKKRNIKQLKYLHLFVCH